MDYFNLSAEIPEGCVGDFRIEHYTVTPIGARLETVRNPRTRLKDGDYTRLMRGGEVIMSNTTDEQISNLDILTEAHGDVLIFGLGIGMILGDLCSRDKVTSVTVVELHSEVIELVGSHVQHPKLTIVQGNAFTWKPDRLRMYDAIYFDIWGDYNIELLPEMGRLMRRTVHWKKDRKATWVGCWKREELKSAERGGYRP